MVTISVISSDGVIWNLTQVIMQLCSSMAKNETITVYLDNEGPDTESLGLNQIIIDSAEQFNYALDQLTVLTSNPIHDDTLPFNIKCVVYPHFINNTKEKTSWIDKHITKTFGCFIGRSNLHRLYLSSYLWNHYQDKTTQTFHYDRTKDFHQANLGLTELVNYYGCNELATVSKFLSQTPMLGQDQVNYPILMSEHCNLLNAYRNFFVEVVCETYYSGNTFFPTEKVWRPIATGTPFIIQGPAKFIDRLHQLGFKTFNSYWDESYTHDPADYQPYEIVKTIDRLGNLSLTELQELYQSMLPILKHNFDRFQELTIQEVSSVQ